MIPSPRAVTPRAPAPPPPAPEAASPPREAAEGARKLIRPSLAERPARQASPPQPARRREAPPDATGAEDEILGRAASTGLVVTVRLESGDVVEGRIEWIDRAAIKLRAEGGRGIVVMRQAITAVTVPSSARRG